MLNQPLFVQRQGSRKPLTSAAHDLIQRGCQAGLSGWGPMVAHPALAQGDDDWEAMAGFGTTEVLVTSNSFPCSELRLSHLQRRLDDFSSAFQP